MSGLTEHIAFQNVQIDLDDIPAGESVRWTTVERGHAWASALVTMLFVVMGMSITFGIEFFAEELPTPLLVVRWSLLGVGSLVAIYSWFAARAVAYAVRDHDIAVAKGLLWRKQIFLVFSRVQHMEISRGPLDRAFDIATLKLFTAGGSSADLSIPGLKPDVAEQIKRFVLEYAPYAEDPQNPTPDADDSREQDPV